MHASQSIKSQREKKKYDKQECFKMKKNENANMEL